MRTTQPNVELALWSTVVDLEKNHKQNVMITATGIDKGHRCTYTHTPPAHMVGSINGDHNVEVATHTHTKKVTVTHKRSTKGFTM